MAHPRIGIIGGGIAGLSTAWRFQQLAHTHNTACDIHVFDRQTHPGGVIGSSERDGFTLEHGPDSIIRTKPAGLQLIRELGLEEDIQGTNPDLAGSLIAKGNKLLPIPDGLYLLAPGKILPFLGSPLMSWAGKLRMGLDLILPRRKAEADEESLAGFVRRRLGKEALARIAQPLVGGIYTADPELLSLSHTMPQFIDMEQEHRSLILGMRRRAKAAKKAKQGEGAVSGARYGLFISLRGGLQTLTDSLHSQLNVKKHAETEITQISYNGTCYALTDQAGHTHEFDAIVCTGPAHSAAQLCADVNPALSKELETIPYAGVATINIAFDNAKAGPLPNAAGFVVPAIEQRSLVACTFSSTKYTGRNPNNGVLLRAFVGGALQEKLLEQPDETLVNNTLRDLRDWFPAMQEPRWSTVHRWPKAMAQPTIGHAARLQTIRQHEQTTPGLGLVGNGYEGVGIPDIIQQAQTCANRIWNELNADQSEP